MSESIKKIDQKIHVPDFPVIPYIEGDGTGPDIWAASRLVLDQAVETAYGSKRKIEWKEVYAGEKAFKKFNNWLPDETIDAFRSYLIGIKGPLTTPVGGGIRSINVALRQLLDLYVCLRPVRYFPGVPSPVKEPEKIDMVIFRENTEDIYAGIEFKNNSSENNKILAFLKTEFLDQYKKIRFPDTTSIGIKPVSREGTERLVDAAVNYAIVQKRKNITLVHKGNIMKFTEGGFRDWGYDYIKKNYNSCDYQTGPWQKIQAPHGEIIIKDIIADAFLQQILLRPEEYDIIATLNLNGDYISDALAAQVGGIGIAPGGNINYQTGHAVFEATHGTAPKYAGQNKVNPGSVILSGEMMLRYMGWAEAADLIIKGMEKTIQTRCVTYDLARLLDKAECVSTSKFGELICKNMSRHATVRHPKL